MTDVAPSLADGADDIFASLSASPPFNALARDRVSEVAGVTRVERFPGGTTILRQGGSSLPLST